MASVEPIGDQTADEIRGAVLKLSEKHGAPGVDLANLVLTLADLDLIPAEIARRHAVLPILVKDEAIFLAMADPSDKRVIEEIEFISGKRVFPYASALSQLAPTIERAYELQARGEASLVGERAASGPRGSSIPAISAEPVTPLEPMDDATVMTAIVVPPALPPSAAVSPPMPPPLPGGKAAKPNPPSLRSYRPTILSVPNGPGVPPSPAMPAEPRAPAAPDPTVAAAVMFEPLSAPTLLPEAPRAMSPAPDETRIPPAPRVPSLGPNALTAPPTLSAPVASAVVPGTRPAPTPRVRTALVIDAEDDSRKLIASALEDMGLTVLAVSRGAAALAIAEKQTLDLLVIDPSLPDLHGFEVCSRLRAIQSMMGVPLVMLSSSYRGWRYSRDVKSAFGVSALIEKPFGILEVATKIETILSGSAPGTESQPLEQAATEALRLANEAYVRGDLDVAIGHLERGASLAPSSARMHYQLALLLGRRGDVFRAVSSLETSVGLNEAFFPALKNLAVLYEKAGFVLKAVESWERALWAAPDVETHKQIKERLLSLL